jgi:hypothetical protein
MACGVCFCSFRQLWFTPSALLKQDLVSFEGALEKTHLGHYRQRWFVLEDCKLYRFTHKGGEKIKSININEKVQIRFGDSKMHAFELLLRHHTKDRKPYKTVWLRAHDQKTLMDWCEQLVRAGAVFSSDTQVPKQLQLVLPSLSGASSTIKLSALADPPTGQTQIDVLVLQRSIFEVSDGYTFFFFFFFWVLMLSSTTITVRTAVDLFH